MPVFNAEAYLGQAIESILNQTYQEFEFVVIDDASTDRSAKIIQSYAQKDKRIKVFTNKKNCGLGDSLNRGIAAAEGDYIARMDADDISNHDRIQKQLELIKAKPHIKILGGNAKVIDENGGAVGALVLPDGANVLRWNMLLGNGLILCHPTVMMERGFVESLGGFGKYRAAQDFELWSRTFDIDPLPIANLQEDILYYRQHPQTNTTVLNSLQEQVAVATRKKTIEKLLGHSIPEEVIWSYRHTGTDYKHIEADIAFWLEIYERFVARFSPSEQDLSAIQEELMQRLSHYIYMNPFTQDRQGRLTLWKALKTMPMKTVIALLGHKLGV